MKYCEQGDCEIRAEEYGGICCKECPSNEDCAYSCWRCHDIDECPYEIED